LQKINTYVNIYAMPYSVRISHHPSDTCELLIYEPKPSSTRKILGLGAAGCLGLVGETPKFDTSTASDIIDATAIVEEFRSGHQLVVEGERTPSGSLIVEDRNAVLEDAEIELARSFLTGETSIDVDASLVLRAVAQGIRNEVPVPDSTIVR
jgi:hypothetical protein